MSIVFQNPDRIFRLETHNTSYCNWGRRAMDVTAKAGRRPGGRTISQETCRICVQGTPFGTGKAAFQLAFSV